MTKQEILVTIRRVDSHLESKAVLLHSGTVLTITRFMDPSPFLSHLEPLSLLERGFPEMNDNQHVVADTSLNELRIIENYGGKLFGCLFGTRGHFHDYRRARSGDQGPIRVLLHLDPDDHILWRLPWELIHDGTDFCLPSGKVSLARTQVVPEEIPQRLDRRPLRVLLCLASPDAMSPLDLDRELVNIQLALAGC